MIPFAFWFIGYDSRYYFDLLWVSMLWVFVGFDCVGVFAFLFGFVCIVAGFWMFLVFVVTCLHWFGVGWFVI